MQNIIEINIDTLAGPTHHFGGLSYGNVASTLSSASLSHPKKAALQGLEKMKLIASFGIPQFIFPPDIRPNTDALKVLGFQGSDEQAIHQAFSYAPHLLLMCSSSSSMWMANAATVSSSLDSIDHKVHITPANLSSNFHRSLETSHTQKLLKKIFSCSEFFTHHFPLPSTADFFDEGAANHTRFCKDLSQGLHFFVYGRSQKRKQVPLKFPARQVEEASHAVARLHNIKSEHVCFAQQNPESIDAGVFHNDVIATGFETLFFFHEKAFVDQKKVIEELQKKALLTFDQPLSLVEIPESALSCEEAVKCYLFNSQLIRSSQNKLILIAPLECRNNKHARQILETLPLDNLYYVDLQESMKNGGGPACLRLRVPLCYNEYQAISKKSLFTEQLYGEIKACITELYPENFYLESLLDPQFVKKARLAVEKLHTILGFENTESSCG